MQINQLLPIGSVVLLKNAEKRLMVFGIVQKDSGSGMVYDYLGVMYPEGNMGEGSYFLFQHSDIDQVVFRGFEDEEREMFIERFQERMSRMHSDQTGTDNGS